MRFITPLHGFCMALADSVPGVSGGTVAFIMGFYDRFINALHDLFGRDNAARRTALLHLPSEAGRGLDRRHGTVRVAAG